MPITTSLLCESQGRTRIHCCLAGFGAKQGFACNQLSVCCWLQAHSPIFTHLQDTLHGLASVRAFAKAGLFTLTNIVRGGGGHGIREVAGITGRGTYVGIWVRGEESAEGREQGERKGLSAVRVNVSHLFMCNQPVSF